MDVDHTPTPQQPQSAAAVRRRTGAVLAAFVIASTAIHFALGPELTKLSPHWSANDLSDQVVAVITLSHKEELQPVERPTPTPTPPPLPLRRTKRNLTVLKYRELGSDLRMRTIRPPARRHATIVVERYVPPAPHENLPDAKTAAAVPEPTPEASQRPGAARTDTGGSQELASSSQWGDDNPPRLIKSAPLGLDDHATGTARVEVDVDPDGKVVDVNLLQSSGDATVDQAALAAARSSTYAPATSNGMPVHGSCVIDFPPTQTT